MLASRAVGPLSQGAHGPAQLLGDHPDLGRLVTRDDENSRETAACRRCSDLDSCGGVPPARVTLASRSAEGWLRVVVASPALRASLSHGAHHPIEARLDNRGTPR